MTGTTGFTTGTYRLAFLAVYEKSLCEKSLA